MREVLKNLMKRGRAVVFGTGRGAKRVINFLPFKVCFFVDNNEDKWGSKFQGAPVKSPRALQKKKSNDQIIVVASQFYGEISRQLNEMGLQEGVDFFDGLDFIENYLFGPISNIIENDFSISNIKGNKKYLPEKMADELNFNFIVSTGRTGTKFLANFFNSFKNIFSAHQPIPNFGELRVKFPIGMVNRKDAKKVIIEKRITTLKQLSSSNSYYLESNSSLFSLIPLFEEVFPNCRIFHIVRDGRDFVRSGMSREYGAFFTDNDPRLQGEIKTRITAKMFPNDFWHNKWENFTTFEKICWYWQKKDRIIYESVNQLDNGFTIRYEDLFVDPENSKSREIEKIAETIGLPVQQVQDKFSTWFSKKINESQSYNLPHWSDWNEEKKVKFKKIAGKHMELYYPYYASDW